MLWFPMNPNQYFRLAAERFGKFKGIKPGVAEKMLVRDGVAIILKDKLWKNIKGKKYKF